MSSDVKGNSQNSADGGKSGNSRSFTYAPPPKVQEADLDLQLSEKPQTDTSVNTGAFSSGSGASEEASFQGASDSSQSFDLLPYLHRREYIAYLQRTIGNDAVGHLWRTGKRQRRLKMPVQRAPEEEEAQAQLQPKLTIGPVNDPYEQEADQVAERVVSGPQPVQRAGKEDEKAQAALQRAPEEEEMKTKLQHKGNPGRIGVPVATETAIHSARGNGTSLPDRERSFYESRIGADFSSVKIHTGGQANDLARSVHARAFTVGNDIFFAGGEYNPQTTEGKKLMAHELTHTVQQGASVQGRLQRQEEKRRGWGHAERENIAKTLKLDKEAHGLLELGIKHVLSHSEVTLKGEALESIKNDAEMKKFEARVIRSVTKDRRYMKKIFYADGYRTVPFGGYRGAFPGESHYKDVKDLIKTVQVALNKNTWMVRHAKNIYDAKALKNGNIHISYELEDVFDLKPSDDFSRGLYDDVVVVLGYVWHDLLGNTDQMKVKAYWDTVISRDMIISPAINGRYVKSKEIWMVGNPYKYKDTIISNVSKNTLVEIIDTGDKKGFNKTSDRYKWWRVRILEGKNAGQTGWVMQAFLSKEAG